MVLTEEEKERIRKNRERALEIQKRRRRKEEEEQEQNAIKSKCGGVGGGVDGAVTGADAVIKESSEKKRGGVEPPEELQSKRAKLKNKRVVKGDNEEDADDLDLEAFEEGASEFVTKQEAKKMYCLPEGTLQVCAVVEKDNPRHSGWSKMKLYNRSEIRRRARKRFGGKEGLITERRKREDERFRSDMEKTKDIFKKK